MAIYRFTTEAVGVSLVNRIFAGSAGYNDSSTYVRIYKGAQPTKTDLDSATPSTFRTSDLLITFDFGSNYWTVTTATGQAALNTSVNATASATGTAAWFMIDVNANNRQMITGTVSGPGGGGDLVIGSTSITSGLIYSLGSLIYTLPRVFT